MIWREVREADLLECLAIEPRHLGDEIVGRECALAVWRELIRSRSFNSCVVESASLPGRILGFGASVFVTREFATREIEDPMPGLNSRIIASIANGASVVRPEADLYNACADQPLDVVTLFGNWIDGLSAEQVRQIQTAFPMSFIEAHLGYRLNRLFQENAGDAQHNYIESSGVWRITKRYTDCERALAVMTRSDAFSVSGSIAASLFQYQEPILGLRDGEKHLLVEALTRRSDDELAKGMNLSPATVKKRWQALFERVTDKHPTLLPSDGDESSKLTRGPQKRHHILAYVRSHPQELRPYRWRSVKDA
jgi:hypothetical protein